MCDWLRFTHFAYLNLVYLTYLYCIMKNLCNWVACIENDYINHWRETNWISILGCR